MIPHILKILWKQRKFNSLLMAELVLSFIALFVISAVIIHYIKMYNEPMGMDYKNVWSLSINQDRNTPRELRINDSIKSMKYERIKSFLRSDPNIVSVSKSTFSDFAYLPSRWANCTKYDNREFCYDYFCADADFATTAGIEIIEGRWLNAEDGISDIKAVVISEGLKKDMFGDIKVAGKVITLPDKDPTKMAIVGVMKNIKREEFGERNRAFLAEVLPANAPYFPYEGMIVKVKPGIPVNFEEQLITKLNQFDNTFVYRTESMDKLRNQYLRKKLAPVLILSFIVIFLIINVMLGLFGNLWLNISRRKAEIGLRRAVGSHSGSVMSQFLGETILLAVISVLTGFLFTSQVLTFNVFNTPVSTLLLANLSAFVIIMILCTISAYAPARLASRMEPSQALHEE